MIDVANEKYEFYNYCVCFIDLLGQRNALKGEGLITVVSDDARQEFIAKTKKSVGAIVRLQRNAEMMTQSAKGKGEDSEFRKHLPKEQQAVWDEMNRENWKRQRWSDGLVYFASLAAC